MLEDASSRGKPLSEILNLIDHILRLGIDYHFEKKIDEVLAQIYVTSSKLLQGRSTCDLHTTALMFRLLRHQGYNISCGVFEEFRGSDGRFKDSCGTDARGLLSLYEASYYRVHGEDILDEALMYTTSRLRSMEENLTPPLKDKISRALEFPSHMAYRRIESWHFIKFYEEDGSHNEVLLEMAKLDFNRLQKQHQSELGDLTRWWKSFGVGENIPFMRDKLVEGYFFGLPAYHKHTTYRIKFSKIVSLLGIVDDLFDVHATFEESELFVRAFERSCTYGDRWDIMDYVEELPEYMQLCCKGMFDLYREIVEMAPEEERAYRLYYGVKTVKNSVRGYFEEARWFHKGHVPSMDEYMRIAMVTCCGQMLFTVGFLAMEDAPEYAFEWLMNEPKMLRSCNIIFRLVDDLITHKFEQKRGHAPSSVECYMKQYGVTEEEAKRKLWKRVSDAWKDVNEELLNRSHIPVRPSCGQIRPRLYGVRPHAASVFFWPHVGRTSWPGVPIW